jgi:hypothetical protein
MTTTLAALLAASATYTAPVAGTADPLAVPPPAAKPGTVKRTANVASAPLISDAAPVKRGSKPAPSSNAATGEVKAAPRVAVEGESSGTLPITLVPGTFDARRFMAAWRHAKNRAEQVTALSGYKGFDFHQDFSSQERTAMFHVRRETVGIAPGMDRTAVRSAQHTAQGFVAGLPHPEIRLLQDLLAQERNVVATMSEHQKVAQDEKADVKDRAFSRNAIAQGTALLRAIREELTTMGAGDVVDVPAYEQKR